MQDELAYLRRVHGCATDLTGYLHRTMTDDPESSPVIIMARGPHAERYVAGVHSRLQALWDALRAQETVEHNGRDPHL